MDSVVSDEKVLKGNLYIDVPHRIIGHFVFIEKKPTNKRSQQRNYTQKLHITYCHTIILFGIVDHNIT